MNITVYLDWKFVLALGGTAAMITLVVKLNHDAAERVSTRVVDSCKELAVAFNGNR